MSKQSDIREGLRSFIEKAQVETHYDGSHTEKENAGYINDILEYLHENGVVIKVKRSHDSDCSVHNMPAYPNGSCDCVELPAGCVAVEPLIE